MAKPKSITTITMADLEPEIKQEASGPALEPTKVENVAYSYVRTKDGYAIVKIEYDLASGFTRPPETLVVLPDEASALDSFKIHVAKDLMQRNRK